VYEELVNPAADEVAATFVLAFDLVDRTSHEPVPIDEAVVRAARADTVTIPDYGRPRSISLDEDQTGSAPALEEMRERGLAIRQVRLIDDSVEADEDGVVSSAWLGELVWGGEPVPGGDFRPLEELPDGGTMGFATMETRSAWARPARRGDRVQSFAAQIDIQAKTMLSRHWLYDVDRAELIAVFTVVNVAFDTTARRAIVIPDVVRERIGQRLHPDLAGLGSAGQARR
jgi:acyl-CoA thioesterase FadM